jgi:threonine dehydrogenase-like Zn-dependent dehydrogenase
MPSLLTLLRRDGHRPPRSQSRPGSALAQTVAVVGDGAVGLCGVIAAKRLGAEQVILLGSNPERDRARRDFGATDVVSERGDEAVERVRS